MNTEEKNLASAQSFADEAAELLASVLKKPDAWMLKEAQLSLANALLLTLPRPTTTFQSALFDALERFIKA